MENSQPHIYSKENLKSDKQMIETVSKKIDKHEKAKQKTTFTFQFIYAFGIVGVNVVVAVFIMTKIGMWFAKKYNNNSLILSFLIISKEEQNEQETDLPSFERCDADVCLPCRL